MNIQTAWKEWKRQRKIKNYIKGLSLDNETVSEVELVCFSAMQHGWDSCGSPTRKETKCIRELPLVSSEPGSLCSSCQVAALCGWQRQDTKTRRNLLKRVASLESQLQTLEKQLQQPI